MGIPALEFEYLRKLMRDHAAIQLDSGKEYIAECRLAHVASQEGFASVGQLVRELRASPRNGLHRKVVDAMTNNETWFFRDLLPYEALRKVVLPPMMAARAGEKRLEIWSAACSSGQEPYSLA